MRTSRALGHFEGQSVRLSSIFKNSEPKTPTTKMAIRSTGVHYSWGEGGGPARRMDKIFLPPSSPRTPHLPTVAGRTPCTCGASRQDKKYNKIATTRNTQNNHDKKIQQHSHYEKCKNITTTKHTKNNHDKQMHTNSHDKKYKQ